MQRRNNLLYNTSLFLNCLLVFLLLFESRVSVPAWLQVIGRMHPLLVHFPIVIILFYFICVFFIPRRYKTERWYINMSDILLLVASLTAALAALMGLLLSKEEGFDNDVLTLHKWAGAATSFGLFIIYTFRNGIKRYSVVNYVLVLGVSVLVITTGHYGGVITHGDNYVLGPVIPEKKRILPAFEDAYVYNDLVLPIFENKCISCHNSNKAKGELIMETKELLLKGGKDGKLWDTTKADLGLLLERIHLPEDEKKHMPPSGKPQLNEVEKEILYAWIRSGSLFDQRVIELSPTDTLRFIASNILKQSAEEQYDFAAADESEIKKLSNNNRVIAPLFKNSPALAVTFYNRQFYTAELLKELQPLKKQIVELNLDNMPVKDDDVKIIAGFTNLRKLILNNSLITGTSLKELKRLPDLKSLSLSGTAVKPAEMGVLTSIPKLKTVYLWNTAVSEKEVAQLQKQNKNIVYQSGYKGDTTILKLTPPIIENDQQIITAATPLKLRNYIKGTSIRYTLDGKEPDSLSSPVYTDAAMVDASVLVKAKSFKPGWISSDVSEYRFFKSTYRPDSAILLTAADDRYKGSGARTLVDLEKTDFSIGDAKWIGYRKNALIAKLYFGNGVEASTVVLSMLQDINGYIFPPSHVEIWGGMDEHSMKLLSANNPPQPGKEATNKVNIAIQCNFPATNVKCIKLVINGVPKLPVWHAGKGEKGWIFIDEVFVN